MAGYATSIINNGQPIGSDVSNAMVTAWDPTSVDLYTKYPQSSGPARGVYTSLPLAPIYRAPGFPVYPGGSVASASVNWQNVGDLVLVLAGYSTVGQVSTGVTASKTGSWSKLGEWNDTSGLSCCIYQSTVASVGADTVSISFNTGSIVQLFVDEATAGFGSGTFWQTVTSGGSPSGTTGTAITWPSLTSGLAAAQAFWGVGTFGVGLNNLSHTSGFAYDIPITPTGLCFCNNIAPSTAYAPTGAQGSSTPQQTADVIISAASGTLSSAYYAGAASGLSGGVGSWVNPTNADGAPDSVYATWTAP